jgi:hypothetical protein
MVALRRRRNKFVQQAIAVMANEELDITARYYQQAKRSWPIRCKTSPASYQFGKPKAVMANKAQVIAASNTAIK